MNVLHVVPSYLPARRQGGPLRSVHGLATALARRGHRVQVLTTDTDVRGKVPLGVEVDLDGVHVAYSAVRGPARLYWSPGLSRALRARTADLDVLHLHSVFLWPVSASARQARRIGLPYVVAPRGMLVPELVERRGRYRKAAWLRTSGRRLLEAAAAIHVTSAQEGEDVQQVAGEFRIVLPPIAMVPNGVDALVDDPQATLSPLVAAALGRRPLALFLGRLSWKKGLDRLVEALPHAPEVTLALAGVDDEGLRPKLQELAKCHGVSDRTLFLGHVDGADRIALLNRCDTLALTSINENFGNVVLEALSCGTPAIVTPGVGLAELVARSGCGEVVAADPRALGEALRRVTQWPASTLAARRAAARAAATAYGWPQIAARMEDVYRQAMAVRPGTAATAAGARSAGRPALS